MLIPVTLFVLVLVLLIIEKRINNYSTGNIAIKIHVNGTRGKSSVTKYIGAAFREVNVNVMAKITGEIPSLIHANGNQTEIKRRSAARVQEQFHIIRKANKAKADALVLECMSIDPVYQKLESSFFNPNIYVITNIRDDHREKMGNTLDEQIQSICNAIPKNCKVIALESDYIQNIKDKALERGSQFIQAIELNKTELENIPSSAHPANVQLALTASIELGISRKTFFKAIQKQFKEQQSPLYSIAKNKYKQYFLNAFSVNDVQSASEYLAHWKSDLEIKEKILVVFNTRADRPLRTDLFASWIQNNQDSIKSVITIGTHNKRANRVLKAMKMNIDIQSIKVRPKTTLKDQILALAGNTSLIVGIGNVKGYGFQLLNEFSEAS